MGRQLHLQPPLMEVQQLLISDIIREAATVLRAICPGSAI